MSRSLLLQVCRYVAIFLLVVSLLPMQADGVSSPSLSDQWHLQARTIGNPAGANVVPAWPTTQGAGVVIGIVDDGLQHTHPDLAPNYSSALSINFNGSPGGPTDPSPFIPSPWIAGDCDNPNIIQVDCHGTSVSGVAGAAGGTGVSGVAPSATLAGIRLISTFVRDDVEATAFSHEPDAISILSNSWGPADDGATLKGPGPLAEAARAMSATTGRSGKGRVFTWAAGNGRANFDNCNFDGYANSKYVIAVGAVDDTAQYAWYSEPCSAMFVTAPSDGTVGTNRSITTTDLLGAAGYNPPPPCPTFSNPAPCPTPDYSDTDYTNSFGGTSSATPVVSGTVALMLANNPNLTARDVKYILRQTAVRINPLDAGWTTGTYPHNEKFGFGLVDAQAAVNMAAGWTPVAAEKAIPPVTHTINKGPLLDNNSTGQTDTIVIDPSEFANFTVEHVEVIFNATHPYRGDLAVTLTSPSSVSSQLATARPGDSGDNFTNWRFGTVRHWGEPANGTWTLKVADVQPVDTGTWNSWTLKIYGTDPDPQLTVSTAGTGPGTVTSSPSAISCGTTCAGFFLKGTPVTLTATPGPNSRFDSWSGCDSPSGNTCTMTMSGDKAVTANFATTLGPDLTMTTLTPPATGATGKTITVANTVRNQGTVTAGTSRVDFYLSADSVITPGVDVLLGSRTVGSLAAGASSAATTTLTIPANTVPGSYYIGAVADAGSVVTELDETNNSLAAATPTAITLFRPDLVMTVLTAPATGATGKTIAVLNTVANQGTAGATAGAFVVQFYLSTDQAFDNTDVLLGSRTVSSLAAGASSTATTTLTIPANTAPASYYLIAVADPPTGPLPNGAVIELDETNNVRAAASPTAITLFRPDLVMTALTAPATGATGKTIAVPNTVMNQGTTGATAGAFVIQFYLSSDQTLDNTDVLLGSRTVSSLAAGASSTATTTLTIPANTAPASYYLIAVADPPTGPLPNGAVIELDETNNVRAAASPTAITLFRPDLVMTALTAPATGETGKTIAVPNTVMNQGTTGATAPASRIDFYLSADNVITPGVDVLLGSRAVASLAAGASSAATTTLTIPATTAPGPYYIGAMADAGSVVTELNESNNTLVAAAQTAVKMFRPDLTVAPLTAPAVGIVGRTIAVPNTVTNQGTPGATAGAFRVDFYLSAIANAIVPGAVGAIGSRTVGSLATGASSAATTTLTIPANTAPGPYYIGAVADGGGVVTEVDETNNVAVQAITIYPALLGAYTISSPGSITQSVCTNPANDGPFTFTGTVNIAAQTGGTFSGTATLKPVLRPPISLTITGGAVDVLGNFTSAFTSTTTVNGVVVKSAGTFNGSVSGNTVNVTISGTIQTGETCSLSGTLTGTR